MQACSIKQKCMLFKTTKEVIIMISTMKSLWYAVRSWYSVKEFSRNNDSFWKENFLQYCIEIIIISDCAKLNVISIKCRLCQGWWVEWGCWKVSPCYCKHHQVLQHNLWSAAWGLHAPVQGRCDWRSTLARDCRDVNQLHLVLVFWSGTDSIV